jgi:hypothetical protein
MRYVENRGTGCQAQNQPDQGPLEQEDCVRQGDCQGGVWVCYFAEGQLMEAMANDGIDLHHTSVVLLNYSETAKTSVRVSWPRSGYVSKHML